MTQDRWLDRQMAPSPKQTETDMARPGMKTRGQTGLRQGEAFLVHEPPPPGLGRQAPAPGTRIQQTRGLASLTQERATLRKGWGL